MCSYLLRYTDRHDIPVYTYRLFRCMCTYASVLSSVTHTRTHSNIAFKGACHFVRSGPAPNRAEQSKALSHFPPRASEPLQMVLRMSPAAICRYPGFSLWFAEAFDVGCSLWDVFFCFRIEFLALGLRSMRFSVALSAWVCIRCLVS